MHKILMREKLFLAVLVGGLLVACAGKEIIDEPAEVIISVAADSSLNPDSQGRPSPIVVRIYSLTSEPAFTNARFFELYENDTDILGDDLLGKQELEISPGDSVTLESMDVDLRASHIAVMAAYRDIDNAKWREAVSVSPNEKVVINVRLNALGVSVSKAPWVKE